MKTGIGSFLAMAAAALMGRGTFFPLKEVSGGKREVRLNRSIAGAKLARKAAEGKLTKRWG